MISVDNNGTSGVPRVILAEQRTTRRAIARVSRPSIGGTADFLNTYTYDALDRLTRVDQVGQSGGNSVAEKRVDLAYNAIGQFTSIARYKDTDGGTTNEVATSAYTYDTLGRLTGLAYTKGGNNLFTPYSWTYDSLSSAGMDFGEAVADPRAGATAASAVFSGLGRITQMVSQDGTSTYGYDSKSELTSATHSYQTNESYSYDNNGNRTMTGYQTGDDNRLTNDGTYSYQYDAEGNRTRRTKTATGEVTEYKWDYHNRLVKVTDKNSQGTVTQVVEYTYDVFDRRIAKEVDTTSPFDMADAAIERYVYDDIHNGLVSPDGGNVVLDFVDPDGSGAQSIAMSKRYLYGEAVDQILAQEDLSKTLGDASRTLWPLVDNLGTVRDLAKQDGTIAAHYKYDSYGNVTTGDTSKTRYLFTSREFDTATDLQYNRARWYDAGVGRWLSEDPLGFAAGDANVGRYVRNRSPLAVDPSGLEPPFLPPQGNTQYCVPLYRNGVIIGNGVGAGIGHPHLPPNPITNFLPPRIPDIPTDPPGPGWVWHPDGKQWHNPGTGESLHPDLDHPLPKGPHWGYKDPYGNKWDWYPDEGVWRPNGPIRPRPLPEFPPDALDTAIEVTTDIGVGVLLYWVISEGSRAFPLRNFVPIP